VVANPSRARPPNGFVSAGTWPVAEIADHHGARVAQALARRLAAAMYERGLSAQRLAALAGVNRQTIANVLGGSGWPDLLTIANLERALEADLWPGPQP
jgi:lambda repressor-like predicted transcriptional regulator